MSKPLIAISLLTLLISACNQPISVTILLTATFQSTQSIASPTSTPFLNMTNSNPTGTPVIVTATVEPFCSVAPHVKVGQQVTVLVEDWDKLKLRSGPEISSGNVVIELNQFSQLKILDGPVCVYSPETGTSHWFWKVTVISSGEVGWVAEGDDSHYYIG